MYDFICSTINIVNYIPMSVYNEGIFGSLKEINNDVNIYRIKGTTGILKMDIKMISNYYIFPKNILQKHSRYPNSRPIDMRIFN